MKQILRFMLAILLTGATLNAVSKYNVPVLKDIAGFVTEGYGV